MKLSFIIGAAVAATVAGFTSLAQANLIAYDGFDTTSAIGTGLASSNDTDATGWSGQWTGSAGDLVAGLSYSQTTPTPATYYSSGDASQFVTDNTIVAFRTVISASQVAAASGATLWVSFLQNNAGNNKAQLSLLNGGGTIIADLGTDGTGYYGVDNGATSYTFTNSSFTNSMGTTALIVAEVSYSSSTAATVSFWADPDFTAASPGPALLTENVSQTGGVTVAGIRLFNSSQSSTGTATFDEIHFGASYSDVVSAPAPEPTTLGLLVPAAFMLATRRRRRSAC